MTRRMTAAEIKAEIYKYEALSGEYSDPPQHDAQFGKLMYHLAEFRQKAVEVQYAARSGGGTSGRGKRGRDSSSSRADETTRSSA